MCVMDDHAAASRIELLRRSRMLRPVAPSIQHEVLTQAGDLKKLEKRTASIAEAWGAVVPEALAAKTTIERLARGVLTVRVEDAPARYELDRFMRSGWLDRLRDGAKASITRVKIVAG